MEHRKLEPLRAEIIAILRFEAHVQLLADLTQLLDRQIFKRSIAIATPNPNTDVGDFGDNPR
jgi:hypothetical protein